MSIIQIELPEVEVKKIDEIQLLFRLSKRDDVFSHMVKNYIDLYTENADLRSSNCKMMKSLDNFIKRASSESFRFKKKSIQLLQEGFVANSGRCSGISEVYNSVARELKSLYK